ncbi:MAG: sulfate ABC transporter permease [Thermoleophilia bacterium]|nr:sulfate ABC transporter permease [Thermoleophilia bacterium]
MRGRLALRFAAVGFLLAVLVGPLALVGYRAFGDGAGPVWDAATGDATLSALRLTLIITLIAVPANAVFGVIAALLLTRPRLPGRTLLSVIIDLPLALSPVVVGLALILVWGRTGWFGEWAIDHGFQVIFALPGMVMATVIVSLPFVVRELVPVLKELGTEQQQAAATLGASDVQILWRIVLPAVRHGLAYGVVLTTARALGEYGAVAVVSGKIAGRTETLTLRVEERFQAFDLVSAYTASIMLALLAVFTVAAMRLLNRERH